MYLDNMKKFKFTTEDLILYILNKIEPEKSNKIALNKLAFFIEFGYFYKTEKELSNASYAGIDLGPVINDYKKILQTMEKNKHVILDGNLIRPLKSPEVEVPAVVSAIIDPLLDIYSRLPSSVLVDLSHGTDSYKITTNNETVMGNIIDKRLALLENFFTEKASEQSSLEEKDLPTFNRKDLSAYDFG